MKKPCILLAGGHLSPAFAVYEQLRDKQDVSVLFIARATNFSGDAHDSTEISVMKKESVDLEVVEIPRLQLFSFIQFIRAALRISAILHHYNPSVTVSFGGYVGFLVSVISFLHRIPIVIHEQTHHLGRANKLIAIIATKVCVSFPETVAEVSKEKAVYTGFPLRKNILHPPTHLSFLPKEWETQPIVYITGGTTGAKSMNELLFPILSELAKQYVIVHQTGDVSKNDAIHTRRQMPLELQSKYFPISYVDSQDVAWLLHHASFFIARSGANTIWELGLCGMPALLLPLPWSANHEQQKNAEFLSTYGGVRVVNQIEMTSSSLLKEIMLVSNEQEIMRKNAQKARESLGHQGSERLTETILSVIPS